MSIYNLAPVRVILINETDPSNVRNAFIVCMEDKNDKTVNLLCHIWMRKQIGPLNARYPHIIINAKN